MDVKEGIELLDVKISRLRIEYEQYFMKILKREPLGLRKEVERILLRYSSKPITNTALKFKYQSLVAKYNSYKYYWTRTLRAIEEGTYERRAEGGRISRAGSEGSLPKDSPSKAPFNKEDGPLVEVYHKYLEARKKCRQPTEGITFERLKKSIEKQKKKIESEYGMKDVDVRVLIKDGTAKIAFEPKRKQ
jgi:hypothetical protein